jgi:hypothetical protein
MPYERGKGELVLDIALHPLLHPPALAEQKLTVTVNGIATGSEMLDGPATLAFAVPRAALNQSRALIVELAHPGAAVPAELGLNGDPRRLGVAVRHMRLFRIREKIGFTPRTRAPLACGGNWEEAVRGCTGFSVDTLLRRFESLGHNCEFGLMQRGWGSEPLGLLRFGGIEPDALLRGLETGFAGIGQEQNLEIRARQLNDRQEYIARDRVHALDIHTDRYADTEAIRKVAGRVAPRLQFLARLFNGRLADGGRIGVLHHPAIAGQAQALPVLARLAGLGNNALLYVTESADILPGTVVQERAGLFHGYIDRLAPMQDARQINGQAWLSLCANAYRMWREIGGGRRLPKGRRAPPEPEGAQA